MQTPGISWMCPQVIDSDEDVIEIKQPDSKSRDARTIRDKAAQAYAGNILNEGKPRPQAANLPQHHKQSPTQERHQRERAQIAARTRSISEARRAGMMTIAREFNAHQDAKYLGEVRSQSREQKLSTLGAMQHKRDFAVLDSSTQGPVKRLKTNVEVETLTKYQIYSGPAHAMQIGRTLTVEHKPPTSSRAPDGWNSVHHEPLESGYGDAPRADAHTTMFLTRRPSQSTFSDKEEPSRQDEDDVSEPSPKRPSGNSMFLTDNSDDETLFPAACSLSRMSPDTNLFLLPPEQKAMQRDESRRLRQEAITKKLLPSVRPNDSYSTEAVEAAAAGVDPTALVSAVSSRESALQRMKSTMASSSQQTNTKHPRVEIIDTRPSEIERADSVYPVGRTGNFGRFNGVTTNAKSFNTGEQNPHTLGARKLEVEGRDAGRFCEDRAEPDQGIAHTPQKSGAKSTGFTPEKPSMQSRDSVLLVKDRQLPGDTSRIGSLPKTDVFATSEYEARPSSSSSISNSAEAERYRMMKKQDAQKSWQQLIEIRKREGLERASERHESGANRDREAEPSPERSDELTMFVKECSPPGDPADSLRWTSNSLECRDFDNINELTVEERSGTRKSSDVRREQCRTVTQQVANRGHHPRTNQAGNRGATAKAQDFGAGHVTKHQLRDGIPQGLRSAKPDDPLFSTAGHDQTFARDSEILTSAQDCKPAVDTREDVRQQRIQAMKERNERNRQAAESMETQGTGETVAIPASAPQDGKDPFSLNSAQGIATIRAKSPLKAREDTNGQTIAIAPNPKTLIRPQTTVTLFQFEHTPAELVQSRPFQRPSNSRIENDPQDLRSAHLRMLGVITSEDIRLFQWREKGTLWSDVMDAYRRMTGISKGEDSLRRRYRQIKDALGATEFDPGLLDRVALSKPGAEAELNKLIYGVWPLPSNFALPSVIGHKKERPRPLGYSKPPLLAPGVEDFTAADIIVLRWRDQGYDWHEVANAGEQVLGIKRVGDTWRRRHYFVKNALEGVRVSDELLDRVANGDQAATDELRDTVFSRPSSNIKPQLNDAIQPYGELTDKITLEVDNLLESTTVSTTASSSTFAASRADSKFDPATRLASPGFSFEPAGQHALRPTQGGKTINENTFMHLLNGLGESLEGEETDDDASDRDPSPVGDDDFCQFTYQLQVRQYIPNEDESSEGIDGMPWHDYGEVHETPSAANRSVSTVALSTPDGRPCIADPRSMTVTSKEDDDGLLSMTVSGKEGETQVRVARRMRTFQNRISPQRKSGWTPRRLYHLVQRITTKVTGDDLFDEEAGSRRVEQEVVKSYFALEMANARAIDHFVKLTHKPTSINLTRRGIEEAEYKQMMTRQFEETGDDLFGGSAVKDDFKEVEVFVQVGELEGPRNI